MQLSAEVIKKEILEKHKNILDQYPGLSIYIFGAARLGRNCAACCKRKGIQVLGFLDNRESIQGDVIDGITVYSLQDYLNTGVEEPIVIASLTYWDAIDRQLRDNGITSFLHYSIFNIWDPLTFPAFNDGFIEIINETVDNYGAYQQMRAKMTDDRSQQILDELVRFRLSLDISCTRKAYALSRPEISEPYFDPDIVSLHDGEVFVDGGAYLGETSVSFIRHMSLQGRVYKHIYLIEPDMQLLQAAETQLKEFAEITFCAAGLSDKCELSGFDRTGDTGGTVNPEGDTELTLQTIDKIVNKTATFIKLDIEGYEEQALLGAAGTIRDCKPKLAVSAYHKCGDLLKLWSVVNEIRNDYKIYVRHYTPGVFDTVLYFV